MFGFDDDDFGLDDLIEADIQYGLFEDDDRMVLIQEYQNKSSVLLKKSEDIYKRLEQGFNKVEQALNSSSYSERALFKAYCELADTFELKFNFLKDKLERDYQFIISCAEQYPSNFPELQDLIDEFSDEYDEMEDCLSAFDDVIQYEDIEGFEDKAEEYSDRKSSLENDLFDIELLKDEIEALDY